MKVHEDLHEVTGLFRLCPGVTDSVLNIFLYWYYLFIYMYIMIHAYIDLYFCLAFCKCIHQTSIHGYDLHTPIHECHVVNIPLYTYMSPGNVTVVHDLYSFLIWMTSGGKDSTVCCSPPKLSSKRAQLLAIALGPA